jgi:hypothetical protein
VAVLAAALWLAPGALAAGWCGSGETATDRPDLLTGAQVHAIVVLPADGADSFAADASRVSDDVASMSTWWTGQDPTRVPRYDLAAFPGGSCLDISFVRLAEPAGELQNASRAFATVVAELRTSGFVHPYKDYVVYYDGPVVQQDVCGTGNGDFDHGGGFAIVWLKGCSDVPTDGIEAHELLHALGALPIGAPNACTPATSPFGGFDTGHPCDSASDVLYPETDGRPLQQMVLDFNHDDYYAHTGSWNDMQDSIFLHRLDVPEVELRVAVSGAGSVTGDLPGVDCSQACAAQWDQGTTVTLFPTPGKGSRFVRWSGSCSGRADCVLALTSSTSATAIFGAAFVAFHASVTGRGKVTCLPSCGKEVAAGDPITLRAVAAKGWKFARWSGGCEGARVTCRPRTTAALSVRATFTKLQGKPKLQPNPKPKRH